MGIHLCPNTLKILSSMTYLESTLGQHIPPGSTPDRFWQMVRESQPQRPSPDISNYTLNLWESCLVSIIL